MVLKGYLFVTGCGRSGTTLVNKLLGAHPRIVLGIERYMLLQAKSFEAFHPDLFERERFFDFKREDSGQFRDGPSNVAYYKMQAEKWDGALYRGDKLTTLFTRFDEVSSRLGDVKFVHVTRKPQDVLLSWIARVEDGTLPAKFGAGKCMDTWNLANKKALRFKQMHPDKITLVDYEKILDEGYIERLLSAVDGGLGYPHELKKYVETLKSESNRLEKIRRGRFGLLERLRASLSVKRLADTRQYKALCDQML